jgi:NAD(P)H-hydrate epimerase
MEILSVAEMREVERIADAHGLSYAQMMHNAGHAAADVIVQRLTGREQTNARILVLAGPGNNGGDGFVCAAALADAGHTVQCYLLRPRAEDDPVFKPVRERDLFVADAPSDLRMRVLHQLVTHADVIVDALLGTGVSRPIDGPLQGILHEVALRRQEDKETRRQNDLPLSPSPSLLVSLDGPTGMAYDTGALDPAAVPADLTITFHAPKRGHYCHPAAEACGELVVVPIGIEQFAISDFLPDPASRSENWNRDRDRDRGRFWIESESAIGNRKSKIALANDASVRHLLPSRRLDGNKGSFGKALIIGGCVDYVGAPTLSARAAYRAGAGLVAYGVPRAVQGTAAILCPEATFVPLPESDETHEPASVARIIAWAQPAEAALAVGPGMGQASSSAGFLDVLLAQLRSASLQLKGLVCDADALNLLAKMDGWPARLPPLTVLTPHPGEMSRLTDLSMAEVQADRIGNALRFAQEWGQVVLLKGAHTVIAAPDGRGAVLPFANPAMATAGSGDVLTGCIVGLMAQGLGPFEAAVCGGYLHGAAGELWRAQHGDAGMLAGDLLGLLPDALHHLRQR